MATGDKLVNLDVLKNTVQKEVVDLKSASVNTDNAVINGKNLKKEFTWEYGSINNDGNETGNTTKYYARTIGYYHPLSDSINVSCSNSLTYFAKVGYKADGTKGERLAIPAMPSMTVELNPEYTYRFVVMMASDNEFDLSDMDSYVVISYKTDIQRVSDVANSNKEFISSINTIGKVYIQPTERTAYSLITKAAFDNPNYECVQINPTSYDEYYVTAQTNTNVPVAMYYNSTTVFDSTTWIGSQGDATASTQYEDLKLIVPSGTQTIFVNNYIPNSLPLTIKNKTIENTIKKYSSKIYAEYDNGVVSMMTRFSDYSDLKIRMGYHGGNNLFDFIDFTEINDDGTSSVMATNTTDFFGPYRVRAINNADGDSDTTSHFTGGNHQYNNTGSGSTPTARGTIDYVLFDDAEATSGDSAYCNKVTVHWTNYIQGQNTKKADGTGRVILREEYTLTYDGNGMLIDHVFVPLEDIKIATYYGLQMYFSPSDVQFQYIGGETRTPHGMVDTNSVNRQCRGMIAYNDSFAMKMQMFPIDIGNWILHDKIPEATRYADYSAFINGTVKKAYFNLVSCVNSNGGVWWDFATKVYHTNERYYFSGEYVFEKVRS